MLINVLDAQGKKVMDTQMLTTTTGNNQRYIDVSNLPKGMYYLQFNANGLTSGRKVVVQ